MKNSEELYIELLIVKSCRGDHNAFMEIVKLYECRLFFYIRRMLGNEDDTWDVLQQTWIAVYRNMKSLKDSSRFTSWLYSIAHNRAVSYIRKARITETVSIEDLTVEIPNEPEDFDIWDAEEIRQALDTLSAPHREVLTLHFLEDFSIDEIADITRVSSGTVKSRIHYARQALKKALKREWLTHE